MLQLKLKKAFAAVLPAVVATIMALTSAPGMNAEGYKGQKSLGVSTGYNNYNKSAIIGLAFTYRFGKLFRIAPDVQYALRHNRKDALMINLNTQYLFPLSGKFTLYPIAGLNFTSWNYHPRLGEIVDDNGVVKTIERESNFGLNLGAGADLDISESLRLSITPGYVINEHKSYFNISATIAYRF